MTATCDVAPPRSHLGRRWLPVAGLFLLSPISAEYLIGYDETIGHPLRLLAGLLILGPLYGAVAVLIRETVRRAGRGWPTVLLLGAAFGLVQAGLIEQSLFHLEFDENDPDWATEEPVTTIPGSRVDAQNLLNWVGGHMIWSFTAPIAMVESCVPKPADRPWLGGRGLVVMVVLYLAGAAVIAQDFVGSGPVATPGELAAAAVAVLALAVAAFALPRRGPRRPGRVPPPWVVGGAAVAVLGAHQWLDGRSWTVFALDLVMLGVLGALLLWWSGRAGWSRVHTMAVAGAALVASVAVSFWVEPLGSPSYSVKYTVNAVLAAGVLALIALAYHRLRRGRALERDSA